MTERVRIGRTGGIDAVPDDAPALRVRVRNERQIVTAIREPGAMRVVERGKPSVGVLQALMGPSGEVAIKRVETLPPGSLAEVVNEGTRTRAELLVRIPRGEPGGQTIRPAALPLPAFRGVATDDAGLLVAADAGLLAQRGRFLGISLQAAVAPGVSVAVATSGPVYNAGWNWAPGVELYVGLAGEITTGQAGKFSQLIGFAISPKEIYIRPGRAVVRA